ncbi:Molecular chaperone Hsp31 and glyoxalase 3 [bacterium HR21]|jgi:DJ-1 family protein|nr:Molecular chaperone Hsp31 and glyoxalase 3 [bacterium HR21]
MRVLVPIANGTEEVEAVTVIDLLRRAGISVVVAGESPIVVCSRGVRIVPDVLLEEVSEEEEFAAIVLPGGSRGTEALAHSEHLQRLLQAQRRRQGYLAAICAAPTILARHRLLPANSPVTSHPSVADQLSEYLYRTEPVVVADRIITSRGVGTALAFALELIRLLRGEEVAAEVARQIVLQ